MKLEHVVRRIKESWAPIPYTPKQLELIRARSRFRVVPCGRRSGKTDIATKMTVLRAVTETELPDARFFLAAPVWKQAKDIFWLKVLRLLPPWLIEDVSKSELQIRLVTGAAIGLAGLDVPERIEGAPVDGIVIDEFGNCPEDTWGAHVRPALSTPGRRPGWAWLIGTPEGRNHYWRTYQRARELESQGDASWSTHHWPSSEVVSADELKQARRELDDLTFRQEYGGEFVAFSGAAYYAFDRDIHCKRVRYREGEPLLVCFDFNREPGVAVYAQEQGCSLGKVGEVEYADSVTAVIGEVWIPRNSNTERVCDRVIADWGEDHQGPVICYGDATGGAGGSAKIAGSDWDIIRRKLRPVFGDRLTIAVPRANPKERARVNSVNSRLRSSDGVVRMLIDPGMAPHTATDLEQVLLVEGGSGEIDKPSKGEGSELSHLTDALGYAIVRRHPVMGGESEDTFQI